MSGTCDNRFLCRRRHFAFDVSDVPSFDLSLFFPFSLPLRLLLPLPLRLSLPFSSHTLFESIIPLQSRRAQSDVSAPL